MFLTQPRPTGTSPPTFTDRYMVECCRNKRHHGALARLFGSAERSSCRLDQDLASSRLLVGVKITVNITIATNIDITEVRRYSSFSDI